MLSYGVSDLQLEFNGIEYRNGDYVKSLKTEDEYRINYIRNDNCLNKGKSIPWNVCFVI